MKCEYCAYNVNGRCNAEDGIHYQEPIENPMQDIDCSAYIEIGTAGALAMEEEFFGGMF